MFDIQIKRLYWISDTENNDNRTDLCAHGDVAVTIGDELLEDSCTVSSAALYLLKSLENDHIPAKADNLLLPCCGHFMIPDEDMQNVAIYGCPNGTDWTVLHQGDGIDLITGNGTVEQLTKDAYQETVFRFADAVQQFYARCSPKIIFDVDLDRDGYIAFWNEWNRRRGKTDSMLPYFVCKTIRSQQDITAALPMYEPHLRKQIMGRMRKIKRGKLEWFAAVEQDEIVGSICVLLKGKRLQTIRKQRACLYDLRVVPAHRHRGIGTALLVAAIESASCHGFAQQTIAVETDDPAKQFYQKLGFTEYLATQSKVVKSNTFSFEVWMRQGESF